jgi:hypothetical protein
LGRSQFHLSVAAIEPAHDFQKDRIMTPLEREVRTLLQETEDVEDAKQYAQDIANDLRINLREVITEIEKQSNG